MFTHAVQGGSAVQTNTGRRSIVKYHAALVCSVSVNIEVHYNLFKLLVCCNLLFTN